MIASEHIDGWMERNDLEWLESKASVYKDIAEIGSWQGRSTRVLCDNTQGMVYAVDSWADDTVAANLRSVSGKQARDAFQRNLEEHLRSGKLTVLQLPSVDAAYTLRMAGKTFDMVFIDADHELESIRADIKAWKPLVRSGGLFCGHDAGYGPILQALRELLPHYRHEENMWCVNL